MKREETLLDKAKALFAAKKEESINFLKETALNWKQVSPYICRQNIQPLLWYRSFTDILTGTKNNFNVF